MQPFLPFIHEKKKKINIEYIPLYIEIEPIPLIKKTDDDLDEENKTIVIEIL